MIVQTFKLHFVFSAYMKNDFIFDLYNCIQLTDKLFWECLKLSVKTSP